MINIARETVNMYLIMSPVVPRTVVPNTEKQNFILILDLIKAVFQVEINTKIG